MVSYLILNFYSRTSNSERYLVLKDFKYDHSIDKKFLDSQLEVLESVLTQMNTNMFSCLFSQILKYQILSIINLDI